MFSIVMMMNAAVNKERKGSGTRRNERGRRTRTAVREDEKQEREEDRFDLRREAVVRPHCASMRPGHGLLSRVHTCNGRRTAAAQHTLGCITRRDLYSRLTSLCEGRIRSDTSLVCTHDSTVPSFIFSLSISLPPLSSPGLLGLRFCSFVRRFHRDGLYPRSYRHFRHRRDSTRGSN